MTSVPYTLKLSMEKSAPPPSTEPPGPAPAPGRPPPLWSCLNSPGVNRPSTFITLRLSPPTASATPSVFATFAAVEADRVWKPWTITRSLLCRSSPSSPSSPGLASNLNLGRPPLSSPSPEGASRALVTVMSVPSP